MSHGELTRRLLVRVNCFMLEADCHTRPDLGPPELDEGRRDQQPARKDSAIQPDFGLPASTNGLRIAEDNADPGKKPIPRPEYILSLTKGGGTSVAKHYFVAPNFPGIQR